MKFRELFSESYEKRPGNMVAFHQELAHHVSDAIGRAVPDGDPADEAHRAVRKLARKHGIDYDEFRGDQAQPHVDRAAQLNGFKSFSHQHDETVKSYYDDSFSHHKTNIDKHFKGSSGESDEHFSSMPHGFLHAQTHDALVSAGARPFEHQGKREWGGHHDFSGLRELGWRYDRTSSPSQAQRTYHFSHPNGARLEKHVAPATGYTQFHGDLSK